MVPSGFIVLYDHIIESKRAYRQISPPELLCFTYWAWFNNCFPVDLLLTIRRLLFLNHCSLSGGGNRNISNVPYGTVENNKQTKSYKEIHKCWKFYIKK